MHEKREPVMEQLEETLENMKEAAAKNDEEAVVYNGVHIHEIIMEAADNPVLVKMWDVACAQQRVYIKTDVYGSTSDVIAIHEKILQELKDRNIKAAKKLIKEFFTSAYEAMTGKFDAMQKEAEKASQS